MVAALLADPAERRLDARRLLDGQAAGSDRLDQLVQRGGLDRRPSPAGVRRAARRRPSRRAPGATRSGRRSDRPRRSDSKACSAFTSAVFWVRIVRISSLVGSSRRSQTGTPYSAARPSRTNGTSPGRVRSRRRTQDWMGSGFRRLCFGRRVDPWLRRPAWRAVAPGRSVIGSPPIGRGARRRRRAGRCRPRSRRRARSAPGGPGLPRHRARPSAAAPSGSTPPPTAKQRTPAAWARRATPRAVLPNAVCASIRPSPVTTTRPGRAWHRGRSPRRRDRRRDEGRATGTDRCRQSSPNPTPPAAPAPGLSRSRRPVAASSRSAQPASRRSRSTTSSAARPLLGSVGRRRAGRTEQRVRHVAGDPEVGLDEAAVEAGQIDRLARHRDRRGSRQGRGGCRSRRRSSRSRRCPARAAGHRHRARLGAARRSRPSLAPTGSRSSSSSRRDRPDASASSTTARSPSSDRKPAGDGRAAERIADPRSRDAPTRRPPRSPRAFLRRRRPAARAAARRRAGHRAHPSASARATSTDDSEPLNESGANTTVSRPSGRAVDAHRRSFQNQVAGDERAVGQQRVVRDRAGLVPAGRPVERLGAAAGLGVEDQQPAALGAGERSRRRSSTPWRSRAGEPSDGR